jgi:hypothetical protein
MMIVHDEMSGMAFWVHFCLAGHSMLDPCFEVLEYNEGCMIPKAYNDVK